MNTTVASAFTTVYTTPSDRITIVKSFCIYAGGTAGVVYIGITRGGTSRTFRKVSLVADTTTVVDPMWVVLEPGDVLFAYAQPVGGGSVNNDYTVSGAELSAT